MRLCFLYFVVTIGGFFIPMHLTSCVSGPCENHTGPSAKHSYKYTKDITLPLSKVPVDHNNLLDKEALSDLDSRFMDLQKQTLDGRWSCIKIKITKEYKLSCDETQQLLKHEPANQAPCDQKGFSKDDNCPCMYRGVFQEENESILFILPPQMSVLETYLGPYVTNNPYFKEEEK